MAIERGRERWRWGDTHFLGRDGKHPRWGSGEDRRTREEEEEEEDATHACGCGREVRRRGCASGMGGVPAKGGGNVCTAIPSARLPAAVENGMAHSPPLSAASASVIVVVVRIDFPIALEAASTPEGRCAWSSLASSSEASFQSSIGTGPDTAGARTECPTVSVVGTAAFEWGSVHGRDHVEEAAAAEAAEAAEACPNTEVPVMRSTGSARPCGAEASPAVSR